MTEVKHTEGPWTAHVDDFGSVYGSTHYVTVDDGVRTIAFIIASDNGKERPYKANARLIAAAPDMLEALESADESIEIVCSLADNIRRHGNYSSESMVGFLDQASAPLMRIKAAIAAARGDA